jgi:hypothetical protein
VLVFGNAVVQDVRSEGGDSLLTSRVFQAVSGPLRAVAVDIAARHGEVSSRAFERDSSSSGSGGGSGSSSGSGSGSSKVEKEGDDLEEEHAFDTELFELAQSLLAALPHPQE